MNAKYSWHPQRPWPRPARIVPAFVDAGSKYGTNQPVPRDNLGRILVRFPFSPTLSWEDHSIRKFDLNYDDRLTKDDFAHLLQQRYDSEGNVVTGDEYDEEMTQRRWAETNADDMRQRLEGAASEDSNLSEEYREEASELADTAARETDVQALEAGDYDDPFPGVPDESLDEEQLEQREELEAQRVRTYRYMAWKRALAFEEAGGDYDHDGYVTAVDERMSDELKAAFADPERRAELEQQARQRSEAGEDGADDGEGADAPPPEDDALVDEYLRLFGEDSSDPAVRVANLQRDAADEQWPSRLPLPVVQPMAGGLHGFVTAHRQGDACRVAVHDVMRAEIIGFQYRSDRDLKDAISGATAGIVVEHNLQQSWSGMVFRRTE